MRRAKRLRRPVLYFMLECKAMAEVTLSSKNQIVIPREARQALQVKAGDKLIVVVRGEKVIVLEKPKSHQAAIRGLARGAYSSAHVQKERQSWD
jgi:AbrB family looped-hinge helix DNA binding protein